jgi:hypothetical protein
MTDGESPATTGERGEELRPLPFSIAYRMLETVGDAEDIVQSYGNWNYERTGNVLKTEEDPLDPNHCRRRRRGVVAGAH